MIKKKKKRGGSIVITLLNIFIEGNRTAGRPRNSCIK